MTEAVWNEAYDMVSINDGQTWRGFARHHPSGTVYILEQDNTPGSEANYVRVGGPYPHSDLTRARLVDASLAEERVAWATTQTWESVPLTP